MHRQKKTLQLRIDEKETGRVQKTNNLLKEGKVWNRHFSKRNLRRYLVSLIRETFIIRCHLTPLRTGKDKMRGQSVQPGYRATGSLAQCQRNCKQQSTAGPQNSEIFVCSYSHRYYS